MNRVIKNLIRAQLLSTVFVAQAVFGQNSSAVSSQASAGSAGSAAPLPPAEGSAPQADNGGIADIVVTARRRAESLIRVPVAVTALDAGALTRGAVTNLQKIGEAVPSVTLFRASSGSGATFTIRGIGSSYLDAGVSQAVAVNIDGVQVDRGQIVLQGFFDTDKLEILKGPQALFFGKNSPAGVISIASASPVLGQPMSGYARVGYEFAADEVVGEAAVSAPIADNLSVRVAGRAAHSEGYLVNNAQVQRYVYNSALFTQGAPGDRQPATKEYSGRLTVRWDPVSDLQITAKVVAGNYKDNGAGGATQSLCFAPATSPTIVVNGKAITDPTGDCNIDKQKSSGSVPTAVAAGWPQANGGVPYTNVDTVLASLVASYSIGHITFTSTTGYYFINASLFDVTDRSSYGAVGASNVERNNTYTQELRINSDFDSALNFTAGGYLEKADFNTGTNVMTIYTGPEPATGKYLNAERATSNRDRTYSVFGQLRWNITDELELAGGGRWTRETRDVINVNTYVNTLAPAGRFLTQGVQVPVYIRNNNFSPEATLSYRPTQDLTIYGGYKTGFKSGGGSNPSVLVPSATSRSLAFQPEKAKGGEIGVKGYLFDRKVRFDVTGYRTNYSNLQVSSFDAPTNSFLIRNAATARVQGVEAQAEWRTTRELTLDASVAYNDAHFESYTNAPCGLRLSGPCAGASRIFDLSGEPLARAPKWAGKAGFTYDHPLGGVNVGVNGDVNYSSSYFTQDNDDPLAKQTAYARINFGVSVHAPDNRWDLALIGRNLTNKYVIAFTNDRSLGIAGQFNANVVRPRQINLQGTVHF